MAPGLDFPIGAFIVVMGACLWDIGGQKEKVNQLKGLYLLVFLVIVNWKYMFSFPRNFKIERE